MASIGSVRLVLHTAVHSLWLFLAVAFALIEWKLFRSNTGLGITLGIVLGAVVAHSISRPSSFRK
jgi:hypothetical protein